MRNFQKKNCLKWLEVLVVMHLPVGEATNNCREVLSVHSLKRLITVYAVMMTINNHPFFTSREAVFKEPPPWMRRSFQFEADQNLQQSNGHRVSGLFANFRS